MIHIIDVKITYKKRAGKKNKFICLDNLSNCFYKHISSVIDTSEGRQALARSMVEPLRRQLSYSSIGRSLFSVEELPRERVGGAAYIARPDELARNNANANTLLNYRFARFDIIDRANIMALAEIQREEDARIFESINILLPKDVNILLPIPVFDVFVIDKWE